MLLFGAECGIIAFIKQLCFAVTNGFQVVLINALRDDIIDINPSSCFNNRMPFLFLALKISMPPKPSKPLDEKKSIPFCYMETFHHHLCQRPDQG